MIDIKQKGSSHEPVPEVEANQGLEAQPSDDEIVDRIVMDKLLKEWGMYVRLKSKIRKLFSEER